MLALHVARAVDLWLAYVACHWIVVPTRRVSFRLYENDSPQRYSLINCYLSSKRRYTKTGSRDVRDPDGGAPGGHAADGWELLEPEPEPQPELRAR